MLLEITKLTEMPFLMIVKALFAICLAFFGWMAGPTVGTPTSLSRFRPAMTPMASTASAFVFGLTVVLLMYGIHLLNCLTHDILDIF